ncbi:GDSL-type esterase/lipase family protein [Kribbella yunnanensis]
MALSGALTAVALVGGTAVAVVNAAAEVEQPLVNVAASGSSTQDDRTPTPPPVKPKPTPAPATKTTAVPPVPRPTPPGRSGSGRLGSWENLSRRISSVAKIRATVRGDGVFMFGDSIAVQDGPALEQLVAAQTGTPVAVHDWSGQPASAAVDALADWSRKYGLPDRIVMAVGTNDIFAPAAFATEVEQAMKIAGPKRTVYWVNVHANRVGLSAAVASADRANSAVINAALNRAAARHPNLHVVRWAEFLKARSGQVSKYLRDGIHTTQPVGQRARNALIAQALGSAE